LVAMTTESFAHPPGGAGMCGVTRFQLGARPFAPSQVGISLGGDRRDARGEKRSAQFGDELAAGIDVRLSKIAKATGHRERRGTLERCSDSGQPADVLQRSVDDREFRRVHRQAAN
jgi:hypothetical protein